MFSFFCSFDTTTRRSFISYLPMVAGMNCDDVTENVMIHNTIINTWIKGQITQYYKVIINSHPTC